MTIPCPALVLYLAFLTGSGIASNPSGPYPADGTTMGLSTLSKRVRWLGIMVEGVAIVTSILLAFGIDRWWDERDRRERETILLEGFLEDLRLDSLDYLEFAEHNRRRVAAAKLLLDLPTDSCEAPEGADAAPAIVTSVGEAFFILGIPARLETVLVSYEEMTATGGSSVVMDPHLRRRLASYYALARDRSDINASIDPGLQRYYAHLEALGYAPSDQDRIPASTVLGDASLRAKIRNMARIADRAQDYGTELLEVTTLLIRDVEGQLASMR
jgi:hypothetical protein